VETAWELGISRSLVSVNYDVDSSELYTFDQANRRKPVTGSRSALSGYQKGKCFYCFNDIHVCDTTSPPDVDHFFPHTLKQHGFGPIIDGVWNLVLSCQRCNRGIGGKSDKLPSLRLLERLSHRNEYLIGSHHPLRETLMIQTGSTEMERRSFLNDMHNRAWALLIHTWEAQEVAEPLF
jgi:5-methylcytosine-specific restriction endonuclease McrA